MKILYDHQAFTMQEYGGISRIFTEILKTTYPDEVKKDISLFLSNNQYLKEINNIRYCHFFKGFKWKYKVPAMMAINKLYTIDRLKKSSFNLFHPTYYDPYFLKYLKGRPFVITFLDLIHEKFHNIYPVFANDRTVMTGKKILLEKADKIIAISESTKKDIIDYYGIEKNKIDVIYLATSLQKLADDSTRVVECKYILFIGNRDIYKNFKFFLVSIVSILKMDKELKLVCGGGGNFSEEEKILIKGMELEDKVLHHSFDNDSTLINLYSNALCFVFPSLYEGFGIPILEAFSCGCPCALSNSSSLPEVGGDAAVYFNPKDQHSIFNAVFKLVNDNDLRQELKKRGFEKLNFFSWDKTIEKTTQVYSMLV